jgi:multiple sugar transport system permease protein
MDITSTLKPVPIPQHKARYAIKRKIGISIVYLIASVIVVVSILPFLWTLSTSLKTGSDVSSIPPKLIPNPVYFQNYINVFKGFGGTLPFASWVQNSIVLTLVNVVGEIVFAAITAFGFSRFRFRLRKVFFIVMLSSAVLPGMVRMLPVYMMFSRMGWTNTYLPLTLPNWFGGMFLTLLFYQYFCTIPMSLDESAKLDGANSLDIFVRIILPLSKPILATAAVLTFMFNWNNFLGPFIYLNDIDKYTLSVGMKYFRDSAYSGMSKQALLAAYAMIMAVPVIIIFFIFQRYFVQGIQLSASKE